MASRSTMHALPPLLLLLLLAAPLRATESVAAGEAEAAGPGPGPGQTIQPTRQSIYSHLTAELQAALGAEQHVRDVFAGVAQGLRDTLRESVLPRLQALVDGVVERAEDAWVAADEAGRTLSVKPCVDSAEGDAQQVVKRALEKAEGCVKAVEEEGELRVREAARLLNEIEDASKGLVTALEACIKEEEAKEAQAPDAAAPASTTPDVATAPAAAPASPAAPDVAAAAAAAPAAADAADTGVSVAEAPGQCPKAAGDDCPGEKTAATGDGRQPKCKGCASGCKCKKTAEDESPKDKTGETDLAQEEENTAEETKDSQPPKKSEGKYENEQKGKKSKEWKENKVKDGGKEKGKYKKPKDGEIGKTERADKKSKDTAPSENPKSESGSGERKEKKGKKESKGSKEKKEKGVESAEGKKGRKKRDLLGFNEAPEDIAAPAPASEPRPPAPAPTPTGEGATAEERHVIACMRSPAMQPLVEQKTRFYQRLQAVLQRTAARQQDAPACVTDHVRKAELKVAAIQQRMASCADRKMREEL